MTLVVISYITYLIICLGITYWVAEVLFTNAGVFIDDIFHGDQELSDSTNKLLKLGFYLLNIGFVLFLMKSYSIKTHEALFEILSIKVGTIVLIVGAIFLLNVYAFLKFRKKAHLLGNLRMSPDAKLQLEVVEKDLLKND